MSRNVLFVQVLSLFLFFLSISCKKDLTVKPLVYSVDTLWFDTMYSQLPTSLRTFTVHNVSEVDVNIDRIALAEDKEYRLNVNGFAGNNLSNIVIPAQDSVFVFVEATFDLNQHDSIGSHENAIGFEYSGYSDRIVVASWSQDVSFNNGIAVGTETWSDQRPYIIYDSLVVKEGHTLTLNPGVKLLFHKAAKMLVYGELKVNGTLENPVVFDSDRPELTYENIAGQWGEILFKTSGLEHEFNWLVLKNSSNGIVFEDDSLLSKLKMSNCWLENSTENLLTLNNVDFVAENCLMANADGGIIHFNKGGSLDLTHCTLSNYQSGKSLYLSDHAGDTIYQASAVIKNCLMGGYISQIYTDFEDEQNFPVEIHSSLIYLRDNEQEDYGKYFVDTLGFDFENSVMYSPTNNIYRLSETSVARDTANIVYSESLPLDLYGESRLEDGKPDVGAFEFIADSVTTEVDSL